MARFLSIGFLFLALASVALAMGRDKVTTPHPVKYHPHPRPSYSVYFSKSGHHSLMLSCYRGSINRRHVSGTRNVFTTSSIEGNNVTIVNIQEVFYKRERKPTPHPLTRKPVVIVDYDSQQNIQNVPNPGQFNPPAPQDIGVSVNQQVNTNDQSNNFNDQSNVVGNAQ